MSASLLSRPVTVLDGGLSNALADRGHDLSDALWTARLLRDAPDEIVAVHAAYFAAGAGVATTASYQASVPSLVAAGVGEREASELVRRSVALARRARDEADDDDLLVAASVGPFGAVLADGSEYRGRYGVSASVLRDFHAPRLELLASAGPDLLAVETIPDVEEAEVLVPLLDELGLPAWFSYAVAAGRTRAGQSLDAAYDVLADSSTVMAAGVNCSAPAEVEGALRTAVARSGRPGVAYPNRGEAWDNASHRWRGGDSFDAASASRWVEQGARWVGGCCRVGPSDISALAAVVSGGRTQR